MENCKDLCQFQIRRNVARLSRGILMSLEDLRARQNISQAKLLKLLPKEYHAQIEASNIFSEEEMKLMRKRVLDYTNDHVRDILGELENYKIEFNFREDK